jgi:hypothetical protein
VIIVSTSGHLNPWSNKNQFSANHSNILGHSICLYFELRLLKSRNVWESISFLLTGVGDGCKDNRECDMTSNTRRCDNNLCVCSPSYVLSTKNNNTCLKGKVHILVLHCWSCSWLHYKVFKGTLQTCKPLPSYKGLYSGGYLVYKSKTLWHHNTN